MNGITNDALKYSKAPLIESVLRNPKMNEIVGKNIIKSPKICAIFTNVCVISNLRGYK